MTKKATTDECSTEDFKEVLKYLDTEIEGLEESIPRYEKTTTIRKKLVDRYNRLIRARNWFAENFPRSQKK